MAQRNWQQAIENFTAAGDLVGSARIFPLSMALAHAGAGDYAQSDARLASIHSDWINEPRLSVAYAMVGISRKNLDAAKQWLTQTALGAYENGGQEIFEALYVDFIDDNLITKLRIFDPDNWPRLLEQAVITEQYYFTLLWQKNFHDAYFYAREMTSRLRELGFESTKWQERTADAAFYNRDYEAAIDHYEAALSYDNACYCNYLKLADIYHIKGDSLKEREYREKIYGRFEALD
jgi:tetratricopeptide (TPR) repeat protein